MHLTRNIKETSTLPDLPSETPLTGQNNTFSSRSTSTSSTLHKPLDSEHEPLQTSNRSSKTKPPTTKPSSFYEKPNHELRRPPTELLAHGDLILNPRFPRSPSRTPRNAMDRAFSIAIQHQRTPCRAPDQNQSIKMKLIERKRGSSLRGFFALSPLPSSNHSVKKNRHYCYFLPSPFFPFFLFSSRLLYVMMIGCEGHVFLSPITNISFKYT